MQRTKNSAREDECPDYSHAVTSLWSTTVQMHNTSLNKRGEYSQKIFLKYSVFRNGTVRVYYNSEQLSTNENPESTLIIIIYVITFVYNIYYSMYIYMILPMSFQDF